MKKQLRLLMLTLLCAVFSTAWGATVIFETSDFTGQGTSSSGSAISATKNDVTFSCNKGFGTSEIRCYSGGEITISSSGGNLTQIVMTFTGSNYGPSKISLNTNYPGSYSYSGQTGTWVKGQGAANAISTVKFKVNAQARLTQIVVTYEGQSTTTYNVTYDLNGGTGNIENLTGVAPGTQITLAAAPTKTGYTFNGWSDGTNTHQAGASYTVNSNVTFTAQWTENANPQPSGVIFYESFNTNDGTGGNDGSWSGGGIAENSIRFDNSGWTHVKGSGANQCAKFGASSTLGSATTPLLNATGDAILTFKAGAWAGDATTLNLSVSGGASLSASSVELISGEWSEYEVGVTGLTTDSKITFSANQKLKNRFFLDEVRVVEGIRVTIGSTGYATLYYSNKAFVVPEGVTAITYTTDREGHIVRSKEYKKEGGDGTFIPQGEAVVLKGAPGTYTFVATTATADPDDDNALHGFDTASQTTAPTNDDYYFYKLSKASPINGEDAADNTVGFWWGATGGAAFEIPAHKAYLAILQSEFDDEVAESFIFDETVGINKVQKDVLSAEGIYTLSGIRVYGDNLPKGIYIVNGKKIVIK